jgi:transporter family protein
LSWIVLALLSSAILALSNMLDKTIVHRYVATPLTLPLMVGFAHTLLGTVIIAVVRVPESATLTASLFAVASGALIGLGGLIWIVVMYRQEISRVIPVTQTSPIFAAIFAVVFLGESMSSWQWAAVVATVSGAIAISIRLGESYRDIFIQRSFFILILAAIIAATANIIGKVALNDLPIFYTHGLRSVGLGFLFLLAGFRRAPLTNLRTLISTRSPALLVFGINEFIVANGALLLLLWALSEGPASRVLALAGTRAMFVVLFSTSLALIWKGALGEETNRQAVVIKTGAVIAIVLGIAGVSL